MSILASGTITALNEAVTVDGVDSSGSIGITISGTWVGTLKLQGSVDGVIFNDTFALAPLQNVFVSVTTINGSCIINPTGFRSIRIIASSYTSGTANISIQLSGGSLINSISTLAGNTDGIKIGNVGDALKVSGNVTQALNLKNTYSASNTTVVAADLLATDLFTISGSATKVVRVLQIALTATQTTGSVRDILVKKRSSQNSGGISVTMDAVPHDSTNAAATSVLKTYSINPTVGTLVGLVRSRKMYIGPYTDSALREVIFDFTTGGQELVLRSASELLTINLNGVTIPANNFTIWVTWTEE